MTEKYLPKPMTAPLMTFDGLEPEAGKVAPLLDNLPTPEVRAAYKQMRAEQVRREVVRNVAEKEGVAALQRLAVVANRDTGQSKVVARFLLGLYNGRGFPFDLTDFRVLDYGLFDDCMAVMRMDANPQQEVHMYFKDGDKMFQNWIDFWGWRKPPE